MAASAQPRLSESPPPQLDRLFEYCLVGLVLVGFLAVLLPGGIDGYTATIAGGAILLRGLRAAGRLRYVIRRGAAAVVAFLLVALYPVDAVWLSGDFMQASVRLLLLFAALNLLIANRPRDYFYVSLLAFLELLTASMFLAGLTYLAVLAVFLALAATAYMTNELRKGWQDAPRVVAPADVRLGLPRRILRVGGGLSAGVLLAASVLFLALPRPQASAGGRFDDPTTVGFSPEINLDKTGALSEDPTPVMRVESLDDAPLTGQYWRAVTLFHFDGMRWTAPGVRSRPLNGTDGARPSIGRRAAAALPGPIGTPAHRRPVPRGLAGADSRLVFRAPRFRRGYDPGRRATTRPPDLRGDGVAPRSANAPAYRRHRTLQRTVPASLPATTRLRRAHRGARERNRG